MWRPYCLFFGYQNVPKKWDCLMPWGKRQFFCTIQPKNVTEDSKKHIYCHFYKYTSLKNTHNVRQLKHMLETSWTKLGVLGRVYVAIEGLNAQLTVPSENKAEFERTIRTHNLLKDVQLYFGDEITVDDENFPFHKLHIKIKNKIVADGEGPNIDDSTNSGKSLTPEEWMSAMRAPNAIIVDCRNYYESEVGYFDGAQRLQIDRF
jgi:UPF0176 protein